MGWTPIETKGQLIARLSGHAEDTTCDAKTVYGGTTAANRAEMAKDVAAFASAFGGTLIVGATEAGGRVVKLESVTGATLQSDLKAALVQYTVPVATTPRVSVHDLTAEEATAVLGREASAATLAVVNVEADPRGPIGVREAPGSDFYRFPVRLADQTTFLSPTELPMWMNSHERRVALQLRNVPRGESARIELHGRTGIDQSRPWSRSVTLSSVDEGAMTLRIADSTIQLDTIVPFAFVVSVWGREGGGWSVAVRGSFLPIQSSDKSRFVPYLGGV